MLTLDGSYHEGGGQIVRTALSLSAITGRPFQIHSIRKGREKPGLKMQHVHCVEGLRRLCGATAEGARAGSPELKFHPGPIRGGTVSVDIQTAGSISLLLQALLLPSLFAVSVHGF